MNKIYKLVWSKVRNTWVVASEIAKGHGKNASVTRERKLLKTAVITAIMGGCLMTGGLASAALTAEQQAVYDAVMAELEKSGGNHYVSITTNKNEKQGNYDNNGATGSDSIAIGGKAVTPSNGSIALGAGAVAGDVNKLPKDNAGRMISIGNESHANNQNTIALGNYAKAYGFMGIAIGTEALTTNDKRPGYNYTDGIAVGNYSISDGTSALAIGERSIAQASNAVSIGKRTYASEDSFAGGNAAIAQSNSIALGHGAVVYQEKKYWDDNKAGMDQMINATKGADAEYIYGGGDNKGWFAYKKMATPNFSAIAVGAYSQVTDIRGTAIGYAANAASKDALAMGTHATVTKEAERGVALGTFSVASRKGDALGYNPVFGKAFENEAEVAAYLGKADEYKTLAEKIKTQQEDYKAKQAAYEADKGNADKRKAANEAKTELSKSVSEKYTMLGAFLSRPGAVSVGDSDFTRQITHVAAGSEDTDAVNVAQLKALDNKVTDQLKDAGGVHYFSVNSDDKNAPDGTNWKNDGASGKDAVAIGKKAAASGESAFATGWKSKAAGYSDIAIGREAEATGGWGVAIGQEAKAQASTAVAMAYGANAKGSNSLAIGVQSEAKTNDSTAYGRGAKALGDVALAVGTLTKAEGNHSSVFGFKATTDSTAWNGTAIGRGAYIGKQMPDGTTPDIGVSDNYYMPVDDDTAVEAGKETKNSTAVGFGAKSFGYQNTAVGAGAEAFDTNTVAVGVLSKAIGNYANALGKQARAEGKDSIAIGHFARAIGESSTVLGDYAITSTLDGKKGVSKSVAVGSHARAASDNSIALGNNSLANIADDVKTEAYLSKEAFKKENGVVSVGNKEYTVGNEKIEQNYRRITNVAGGADDHDAVNVAQLKALTAAPMMNFYFGGKNENNVYTPGGTNWSMSLNEFRMDFGDGLKAEKVEKDGKTYTLVTLNKDSLKNDPAFKGDKGDAGAAGKDGKSAYDIWKEKPGNENKTEEDFRKDLKGEKGENGKDGAAGKDGKSAYDIWKEKPGNENKTEKDFLDSLKGKDGKDGVGGAAVEAGTNISVDKTDPAKAIVSLKKEITVDSVNAGGVTIDKAGINAGGKKVTGVAPGDISKDSTDAVNGSQLFAMNQQVLNNTAQIGELRDESREGDAMGAAMAALKPIGFDPYQRSQVMAGVGYYRGKEAVALGLAHYKNEDLMFHGGLAYAGSSELMANIGVTYRFGSKDDRDIKHERNLRMPQYAEGPISSVYMLQDEVERLTKENKEANDRIAALEAKLEQVLEKIK